jgi:hypothetical protein
MKFANALLPRFIAICGHPTSGKSTLQKLMFKGYGIQPVDDGGPLRKMAMAYLGLSYDDCYTQEGKLQSTTILDRVWENREILGEIGNAFEEKFGGDVIPLMVINSLEPGGKYCFGSVRRKQGHYYKKHGGVVIGLRNPLAGPSKFEFDSFDETAVDYWIENDGLARGLSEADALLDLEQKLFDVFSAIVLLRAA